MSDDLLTTAEVAQMLRVSQKTISRWVRLGDLQAIRLPRGQLRIRRSEVERLLREGVEVEDREPVEQESPEQEPPPGTRPRAAGSAAAPTWPASDAAIQRRRRGVRPTLVAAVIPNGERVLMTKRRYAGEPEMWSWPAGHVDPGERPEDAVLRELNEELLVSGATVVRHLGDVDYHGDVSRLWPKSGTSFRHGYRMIHYLVALKSSRVEVIDHEELLQAEWLTLDQVRQATASFPPELAEPALLFASEAIRTAPVPPS